MSTQQQGVHDLFKHLYFCLEICDHCWESAWGWDSSHAPPYTTRITEGPLLQQLRYGTQGYGVQDVLITHQISLHIRNISTRPSGSWTPQWISLAPSAGKIWVAAGCPAPYIASIAVYRLYLSPFAISPGPKISGTSSSDVIQNELHCWSSF
jgi:hypothetical protein